MSANRTRTALYIRQSLIYAMLDEFSTIDLWTPCITADFILKYHRIFKVVAKQGTVRDSGI